MGAHGRIVGARSMFMTYKTSLAMFEIFNLVFKPTFLVYANKGKLSLAAVMAAGMALVILVVRPCRDPADSFLMSATMGALAAKAAADTLRLSPGVVTIVQYTPFFVAACAFIAAWRGYSTALRVWQEAMPELVKHRRVVPDGAELEKPLA